MSIKLFDEILVNSLCFNIFKPGQVESVRPKEKNIYNIAHKGKIVFAINKRNRDREG